MMDRHLDDALPFPVSVGSFPLVSGSGEIALKNDLQASTFQQCVT